MRKKEPRNIKIPRPLKIILCILLCVVIVVALYFAYVFISYDRIKDNQNLEVLNNEKTEKDKLSVNTVYSVVSWNIGFGAYSDDYSFFMDGGQESRGWSKEAVLKHLEVAGSVLENLDADFFLVQEVDTDSTRSYHIDESVLVANALKEYSYDLAMNYDSPYLCYPVTQPHGKSKAGIMTLSEYKIESAIRRSLPVEKGFMKILDLDRCYSVTKIPLNNGKYLCLYNLHLSAYTSDGLIAFEQLKMLGEDMKNEYENGNYCVAGGDFNKDLLGDSEKVFGVSGGENNWAQPIPEGILPDSLSIVCPTDRDNPVPSCRNADIPYYEGVTFVLTVDGFIVSDNVKVISANVEDEKFAVSDHNPVKMEFMLVE